MDTININHKYYLTRIFVLLLIFGLTLPKAATATCKYVPQENIKESELKINYLTSTNINIYVNVKYKNLPRGEIFVAIFFKNSLFHKLEMYRHHTVENYGRFEILTDVNFKKLEEGYYDLHLIFEHKGEMCVLRSQQFSIKNNYSNSDNNSCNYSFKSNRENICITDKDIINKCIKKYKQYFGNPISSCVYNNLTCQDTSGAVSRIAVDQQNGIAHYFYQGRWFKESLSICD